jgi:UTP--glucose-1-phosphate uridylyltransferase
MQHISNLSARLTPFAKRMEAHGIPWSEIKSFEYYYTQLMEGKTGFINESSIRPVNSLPDAESLPVSCAHLGRHALSKTASIKLNGGLGTSMGLDNAKSLLMVKNKLSFLDIAVRNARKENIYLVFMNSFMTHKQTLSALKKYHANGYSNLSAFQQHKIPKVVKSDLTPADWPYDRRLEWCPPGHGNIYAALLTSGSLDKLIKKGYEYAFISNIDNLGAFLDPTLLGYFIENKYPFMMEVAGRMPADKKGGHLACRPNGQLILRELAQCPDTELDAFQDTNRYKYFNTNNLWINLISLKKIITNLGGVIKLPMIRNEKNLDPRDSTSPRIYQLETAMGSAIELFEGAAAVRVPRTRFAPVKSTEDLLAIRSDIYNLTDEYRIVPNPARKLNNIEIDLDPRYYRFIDKMEARFPHGVPSLVDCEFLQIRDDFKFGRNVVFKGNVKLVHESEQQATIKDGSVISGFQ